MKHFIPIKRLLMSAIAVIATLQVSAVATGTYTVGTGGNYPNLSAAFADLNSSSLTGPVVLSVLPGSYSGASWQAVLNNVTNSSASNTITVQAQAGAGTVTITQAGSPGTPYLIKLNGSTFVTIKNLTLVNSATASSGTCVLFSGAAANDSVVGCTMSTGVTTSNAADMAIIQAGTAASPITGGSLVFKNNAMTNGSAAVWINAASGATSDNDIVDNNTITNPNYYGVYVSYVGNLKMRSNNISSNSVNINAGLYLNNTASGYDVSSNTVNINTTTGTHYGVYNNSVNAATISPSNPANMNSNTVSVTVTTGSAYSIYNLSSYYLNMNGNSFAATSSSSGVVYPPTVAYNGTNVTAINNTFSATCNSGSIANDAAYSFIYNANTATPNNIIVRGNTFNYSTTSGQIGYSTTSYNMYYPYNCTINKNTYNISMGASTSMYGLGGGYYHIYNATNTTFDSNKYTFTAPLGTGTVYGMGYYNIYGGTSVSCSYDTFNYSVPGAASSFYGLGLYSGGYSTTNGKFNNNIVNINITSGTSYTPYYMSGFNPTNGECKNNILSFNTTSATGYFPYMVAYQGNSSAQRNNTFTYNATGAGTVYAPYYLNFNGSNDTVENNTWTVSTVGGTIYSYKYGLSNLSRNNTWNMTNTTGTIFNYVYLPQTGTLLNNKFNMTTTSGTIYGCYAYNYYTNTSDNHNVIGNVFDVRSTSGTVYGFYGATTPPAGTYISNIFVTKTTGPSYLLYFTGGSYSDFKFMNNTFHSNSTGTINQMIYQAGASSSYPGKMYLYNNIFSRSNAATGNAVDISDSAYFVSDHNIMYTPGTPTLNMGNPVVNTSSLAAWRAATGRDKNSLFGNPGLTDPANYNFTPNANDPNSWNINGRGIHMIGDTFDITGAIRPKTRFQGPPDLGAYEFTPTSVPADAVAAPANPVANTMQAFLVGGDTALLIKWGNIVPSTINVKQYSGVQANPMPYPGVGRTYNYVAVSAPLGVYEYLPYFFYKDPQLGDISTEPLARLGRSANNGAWIGYNYSNGITDINRNTLTSAVSLDSLPAAFSGVENARIGIRCVVAPSGLAHTGITAFAANETWNAEFSPIGYQVVVDNSPTDPSASSVLYFTPTNNIAIGTATAQLTEFTKYFVHVRTICGAKDTSGWAVDSFITLITCHTPQPQVSSVTGSQAIIYWDSIRTSNAYEYVLDQNPADPPVGTPISSHNYLSQSLLPGNTYYFHVRSHCSTMYDLSNWGTVAFSTWPESVHDLDSKAGIVSYPNPVSNTLTILSAAQPQGVAIVTVTDLSGKLISTTEMKSQKLELNMSGLAAGIYNVKYTDNAHTEIMKVTKQ